MSKKTKTILRSMAIALAAIIIGISLYLFNASLFAGHSVSMPFGVGASVVLSGSMEPTLKTGDLIFIKAKDTYSIDDIVVYQDGMSATVHRIISIDGNAVTTMGDANNTSDSPIDVSQIRGVVTGRVPLLGFVISFLKTPLGIISIITAIVLLLERSYRSERKVEDERRQKIKDEIAKLKG